MCHSPLQVHWNWYGREVLEEMKGVSGGQRTRSEATRGRSFLCAVMAARDKHRPAAESSKDITQLSTTSLSSPPQEIPPRSLKRIENTTRRVNSLFFLAAFLSASASRSRSFGPVRCSKYLPSARCEICKTRFPPSAMSYPRQTRFAVTPCPMLNSSYHFDWKQTWRLRKLAVQVPKEYAS